MDHQMVGAFAEEMLVLHSIYNDELTCVTENGSNTLAIIIHPSTGDKSNEQYVCLKLVLIAPHSYPMAVPKILIQNPRGLSDAHISSIEENLSSLAEQRLGENMLFELIEYARDSLTDNNHPNCVCPICLEYFQVPSFFIRTPCYHYFHEQCMRLYVRSLREIQEVGIAETAEVACPVCRLKIAVTPEGDSSEAVDATDSGEQVRFVPSEQYLAWREKCRDLYDQQKAKGGIIDIEFERTKYLIGITAASEERTTMGSTSASSDTPCSSAAKEPVLESDARGIVPGTSFKPDPRSYHLTNSRNRHSRSRGGTSRSGSRQDEQGENGLVQGYLSRGHYRDTRYPRSGFARGEGRNRNRSRDNTKTVKDKRNENGYFERDVPKNPKTLLAGAPTASIPSADCDVTNMAERLHQHLDVRADDQTGVPKATKTEIIEHGTFSNRPPPGFARLEGPAVSDTASRFKEGSSLPKEAQKPPS